MLNDRDTLFLTIALVFSDFLKCFRVKWIDRSNGKVGVKVVLIDGQRGEGQALRAIQSHYRTTIEDMPVSPKMHRLFNLRHSHMQLGHSFVTPLIRSYPCSIGEHCRVHRQLGTHLGAQQISVIKKGAALWNLPLTWGGRGEREERGSLFSVCRGRLIK